MLVVSAGVAQGAFKAAPDFHSPPCSFVESQCWSSHHSSEVMNLISIREDGGSILGLAQIPHGCGCGIGCSCRRKQR